MARYKKGESGNLAGKPKGALSPSGRLRQAIAEDIPQILAVLREQALSGDVQAAALLISRALPALRPESAAQVIEVSGRGLGERSEAVVGAAIAGQIAPDAAAGLMSILTAQAKILETVELERRIAELEKKNGQQT
jgi:hypothetical protein